MERHGGKTYSPTDIGNELGISANKVGRLAKKYGIKTPEDSTYIFWFRQEVKGGKKRDMYHLTPLGRKVFLLMYYEEQQNGA